jgi:hypothetical protein
VNGAWWWRLARAIGPVLVVVVVARGLETRALLEGALGWIGGLGPWGPVLFALLYALGLLATVAVTVYVTRVARAALARRVAS